MRVNIKEVVQSPKTEIDHKVKEEDTAGTKGDIIKLHAEFQGFQTFVNLTILKLEESVKSELHLTVNQLKLIPDILVRIRKTEEEVKYSSEKITEINANMLMNEEKITTYERKIEKKVEEMKKKQEKLNVQVNGSIEKTIESSNEQDEKIKQLRLRIMPKN